MYTKLTLLIAAVVLVVGPSVVTNADAPRPFIVKDDRNKAFDEFDRLLPLVKDGGEEATEEVTDALEKGKSVWLTVAAVEAVRQAEVDQSGAGAVFLPQVLALTTDKFKKLHKEEILMVNIIACLGELADGNDEATVAVVEAFVAWQTWTENKVVRLRHMAERVLTKLTDEDCTLTDETKSFWEWWARNKKIAQETKAPEKQSKTAPIIFKEPIVGTRLVFIIDISDSMKWPIAEEDLPKIKKKAAHLNWKAMSDEPTVMELAKAELAYSINNLRPDPNAKGKKKKGTRSTKNDPDARTFAIVTYSSEIEVFTSGWIEATNSNCNSWMKKVEDLEPTDLTNIDGALRRGFELSGKRTETADPEFDKDCVLTGAHSIVFLTDGFPTWSNDSESQTEPDRWGRENKVGDGEYVKNEKLIELLTHINRFRKVVVNTVGIGRHDKELMKKFAKLTGGGYTDWECKITWK